jgi:5-methylcytosine-specific restriction enzyme subunit McrC
MTGPTTITLTEYQTTSLPPTALPREMGELLWRHYAAQIEVVAPSFQTGDEWRLTAQGWAGHIPLSPDVRLHLLPKTPLHNLFGMLDYTYELQTLREANLLTSANSVAYLYERLAGALAQRVLERSRRGFYRAYVGAEERLPYVRGRLELARTLATPWQPNPACRYQEQTADVEENRIIAWTLWQILRSGIGSEAVLPLVRQSFDAVQGAATLEWVGPKACVGRAYHRLNQDYRPIHALCRFFLEHTGPGHLAGDHLMLPFLIDMARLFEQFVAEWLRRHLPTAWQARAQERITLEGEGQVYFEPDLLLYHAATGQVHYILDTKYKTAEKPSAEDIAQVIAYAHLKGAAEAVLVYPTELAQPVDVQSRGVRVRSLPFRLDGNLEEAGQAFLSNLGMRSKQTSRS